MNRVVCVWAAVLLFSSIAICEGKEPKTTASRTQASIAEVIRLYAEQQHTPGISWSVVAKGKSFHGAIGLADVENNVPVSSDSLFRIGSISKTLTAALISRLAEQGSLTLTEPIQKNCPAFPEKQWPLTVKELLSHQGGVRNYRSSAEYFDTRRFATVTSSVELVAADPLSFEPGTKYAYTSYGYNLLGCAVEGVTKTSYFEALRTQVLAPLALGQVAVDDVRTIISHRVHGYALDKSGSAANAVFVDTSSKLPGGGLLATSSDLAQFGNSLMEGKLLGKKYRDAMWTEQSLANGEATGYGLGWRIATFQKEREVYHGGESSGFSGMLYLLPDSDISISILANVEQLGDSRIELARKIASIIKTGE